MSDELFKGHNVKQVFPDLGAQVAQLAAPAPCVAAQPDAFRYVPSAVAQDVIDAGQCAPHGDELLQSLLEEVNDPVDDLPRPLEEELDERREPEVPPHVHGWCMDDLNTLHVRLCDVVHVPGGVRAADTAITLWRR